MSVDISEDGMERSMKQGLKSLQKMRNLLEVSICRWRKWYKLYSLKTREFLDINDSGKYNDVQQN